MEIYCESTKIAVKIKMQISKEIIVFGFKGIWIICDVSYFCVLLAFIQRESSEDM